MTDYEGAVPALNSKKLTDAYLYQKALVGAADKVRQEIEGGALEELLKP